jgi:hypothetical protein
MKVTKVPNYLDFLDFGRRPGRVSRGESVPPSMAHPVNDAADDGPTARKVFLSYASGGSGRFSQGSFRSTVIVRPTQEEIDLFTIYCGRSSVIVRTIERPDDYARLRERIRGFAGLEKGWDSYDADAPSELAISAALALVNRLEGAAVLPEWVTPTSDSSILMRYRLGDVFFEWEFHSDGEVAVMRKPLFDRETYHDLTSGDVATFFSSELGVR